jgi:FkbM family methyltransferase
MTHPLLRPLRRLLPDQSLPLRLWRRYRAWRYIKNMLGPPLLEEMARAHPQALFIQIGSNDGVQYDPLRKLILEQSWRGIMVEPVPYVYQRLKANYGHLAGRVTLENVAVAAADGSLPFYHLRPVKDPAAEGLPGWYDGIGSFIRANVAKHVPYIPDIEQRIVTLDVEAVSFDTLCSRNGVTGLELLHMDTEGYDFELLKHIDFTRYRPRLVIYEHYHLNAQDRAACRSYLARHGYETMLEGMDTWAFNVRNLQPAESRLLALWRKRNPDSGVR